MNKENIDYLIEGIKKLEITPHEKTIEILLRFYEELLKFNAHTNLTRIIDEKDFIDKHLFDSLSCIRALPESKDFKIIDIGTGGGFPLMPLWIFFPEMKVTFVDSINKKLDFTRQFSTILIEEYGFKKENITITHSRAEDLARNKAHKEKYDVVVSRGVSKLPSLIELNAPFVKVDGLFIAMKLFEVDEELAQAAKIIEITSLELVNTIKFELLDTGLMRALVLFKKLKTLNPKFPRRAGLAQKEPII